MNNGKTPVQRRVVNLSLAAVAGKAGCATVIIVFGALILGLWLDRHMGVNGPCIFGMLILSIPISMYVMLKIALGAISRITPLTTYVPDHTVPAEHFEEESS